MGDQSSGCGLLNVVFGRRKTSACSLPITQNPNEPSKPMKTSNARRRHSGSNYGTSMELSSSPMETSSRSASRPSHNSQMTSPSYHPIQPRTHPNEPSAKAIAPAGQAPRKIQPDQCYVNQGKRVPKEAIGISGELESMINDHQKTRGSTGLVRASSSNVMLYSNLGNLRQPGGGGNTNSYNVMDYLPKTAREETRVSNGRYTNHDTEKKFNTTQSCSAGKKSNEAPSMCRALSTRMDPEQLKIMGNEDYKNGRFAEALALYDAAISVDPNKASYRSNRSAALTSLGRLLDAVFECREAIRIEPHYHRAHHRLGNLYLRLGEAERALYHYKHAGPEADPDDIAKVKKLQVHLNKCTEARRVRDWNTLIKETKCALSGAADSAPQIFALQAEALLKLNRHQEAEEAMSKCPNFDIDAYTKFFGPIGNANFLVIKARVDLAVGSFDDSLEAAHRAARLDSNNKEANAVLRKARAVAAARSKGNELFKASQFSEACFAYGTGLENDPYNSVLLCNRAACLSKLGQLEKAVEDCTAALNLRPSYSKARLRRADCNAKLERWEASIQDYEVLLKETPEDEDLRQALLEAQTQLKKRRGGEDIKSGGADLAVSL